MISIFRNSDKKIDFFTKTLSHFLKKKKIAHHFHDPFASFKSQDIKKISQTKLAISLGGDGTILKIFNLFTQHHLMPPYTSFAFWHTRFYHIYSSGPGIGAVRTLLK